MVGNYLFLNLRLLLDTKHNNLFFTIVESIDLKYRIYILEIGCFIYGSSLLILQKKVMPTMCYTNYTTFM